jgi:hypothetical protein
VPSGDAAALFSSDLSAGVRPTPVQVDAAILRAVSTHGGVRGCSAEVAAAYGERPETAATRMRWARQVVEELYSRPDQRDLASVSVLVRPPVKGDRRTLRALAA